MHPVTKLIALPLALAGAAVMAAPPQRPHSQSPDLLSHTNNRLSHLLMQANSNAPLVSSADVGDADSFGRNVVYAGLLGSYDVILQSDCSGFPSGDPGNQCLVLNPQPAVTTFNLNDIGHITLPGNSTHSLLCFQTTTFQGWDFRNETGAVGESQVRFQESLTIESALLDDPSLINSSTGLPFNGQVTSYVGTNIGDGGTLQPGESRHHEGYSTRACQGGVISANALSMYGVPANIIDKFFKQPITLRLNVNGNAAMADDAFLSMGVRIYGD